MALYVLPGRIKPSVSRLEIEQRYDLCEDLAQLMFQTMQDNMHELDLPVDIVMPRVAAILHEPNLNLTDAESGWVLSRLNELSEPLK